MSSDKNMFGGGNANSLYIPMSDVEQEAISRLVEEQLLVVEIVNWGFIRNPDVTFGDKRLSIHLDMTFSAPEIPMEVHYFDFQLKRGNQVLFQERHRTYYNHKPISVGAGTNLNMVWDIAIAHLDPKLVKSLVPHARGLTSRLADKDTGEMTTFGNMKLSTIEKQVAMKLKTGEEKIKAMDRADILSATKNATHD